MEDAVESLVVEEESKKLVKSKSIFHRFRNKSMSENNNGTDAKDSAVVVEKVTTRKEDNNSCVNQTSSNEDSSVKQTKPNGVKESILDGIKKKGASSPQRNSSCLLLRLFESKLFDMSIAMSYLFKSKESGVQAYLGNKLFVSIPQYTFQKQERLTMLLKQQKADNFAH